MTNKILLQPSFILHTRHYRDTSLLIDLFSQDYGRMSVIARGARGQKSRGVGLFQPFVSLLCSWSGKGELMLLTHIESQRSAYLLEGDRLLSALYINEIVVKLLHRFDPYPELYHAYHHALIQLTTSQHTEKTLRLFEKQLLTELGYRLTLNNDALTGEPILADQHYHFDPHQGLILLNKDQSSHRLFQGHSLLALHEETLFVKEHLQDAKRLMRIALGVLLNGRPIRSRELFS